MQNLRCTGTIMKLSVPIAARRRAAQFAGIRTDEDLNIIGDPLLLYCQPALIFCHPQAVLITGITPQQCLARSVAEAGIHRPHPRPIGAARHLWCRLQHAAV